MNFELLFGYLIPVILIVFVVRAAFRLRHPRAIGSDAWFHLHASEEISKHKHRMPRTLKGFIIISPFDYPPLVHWELSFISRRSRERLEPFYGSVVDTVQVGALFLFALYLTGKYEIAFISGILFAFYPILLKVDGRVFSLSPRPVGELSSSLSVIFALLFVWFGNILSLVLAMLFLSFVLLSSKFGTQAVFFIYVIMAILLLNPYLLLILAGGFVFAVIMSKGHYAKVLSGHIRHSNFYRRSIVHKHSWTKQVTGLRRTRPHFHEEELGPKAIAVTLLRNPVIFSLSHSPLILVLFLLLLLDFGVFVEDVFNLGLLVWVLASFIPVLVVSLRQLRYLGEAERYLEYGTIPLCVLVPSVLYIMGSVPMWILLFLLFVYSMALVWINYRMSVKEFVERPGDPTDLDEMLRRLNELPSGRVLPIPITSGFVVAYMTNHQALYWGGNVPSENFSSSDFDFIFKDEFPFPTNNLGSLTSKYGLTHILVWKRSLDRAPPGYYDVLSNYPVIFENDSYAIYRCIPPTAGEQSE